MHARCSSGGAPWCAQTGGTWWLVGVVIWGHRCAEPHHSGIYAKVAESLDWDHDNVG